MLQDWRHSPQRWCCSPRDLPIPLLILVPFSLEFLHPLFPKNLPHGHNCIRLPAHESD